MRSAFRHAMQKDVQDLLDQIRERLDSMDDEVFLNAQRKMKIGNLYDYYYGWFMGILRKSKSMQ